VWRWDFAGPAYSETAVSSSLLARARVQSFGVCSLGGAVVAVYALRVSWSSVVSAGISDDTFKVLPFDEFFDEARHCGTTIVNL